MRRQWTKPQQESGLINSIDKKGRKKETRRGCLLSAGEKGGGQEKRLYEGGSLLCFNVPGSLPNEKNGVSQAAGWLTAGTYPTTGLVVVWGVVLHRWAFWRYEGTILPAGWRCPLATNVRGLAPPSGTQWGRPVATLAASEGLIPFGGTRSNGGTPTQLLRVRYYG